MRGLLIPDAHSNQGQDLSRFVLLNGFIRKHTFDFIMTMGDFVGLDSISHWNKKRLLTSEGKRYREDMAAGNKALDILLDFPDYCCSHLYYLGGNHEYWGTKFVEENPSMEGFVDPFVNLRLKERGFSVTPYKEYLELGGVQFTHVPMKGGNPVQGNYVLQRAFEVVAKSTVFGHLHRWETMNGRRLGEDRLIQLATVGCFFEEEYEAEFLKGCPNPYWRGVAVIDIYAPGMFDLEQVSLARLERGL